MRTPLNSVLSGTHMEEKIFLDILVMESASLKQFINIKTFLQKQSGS